MATHFTNQEFLQRTDCAVQSIQDRGLDGILLFAPESQYYLTGYDTFGFAMFQCMVVSANGDVHLLTRLPDLRQAQQTSILTDSRIHIWTEVEGANPCTNLLSLQSSIGFAFGRDMNVNHIIIYRGFGVN